MFFKIYCIYMTSLSDTNLFNSFINHMEVIGKNINVFGYHC